MLKEKWNSEKIDEIYHELNIPGHSSIAKFVYKMNGANVPDLALLKFHHTLLYAPVYQSFYEKLFEIYSDDSLCRDEKNQLIDEAVCEMNDIIKWTDRDVRLKRIDELETEIANLRNLVQ